MINKPRNRKKKETILILKTNKWNKQTKQNQDKVLLYMYGVLANLEEHRKVGIDDEFWAQF